jgi:hypothetical protein
MPVGYSGWTALRREQCSMQRALTRLQHSKQLISITIGELGKVTLPLQWNTWYHATNINRRTVLSVGPTPRLHHSTESSSVSGVESSWELRHWKPVNSAQELQWYTTANKNMRSWGIYGDGSCYQTTGKHTAVWEDLVCAVVNCSVCELAMVL